MSVERGDLLKQSGKEPSELLEGYDATFGLARFTVRTARENGQGIKPDPQPASATHAIVFSKVSKRRKGSAMDALALGAVWEVVPQRTA
jgi:hypothetical protein